MSEEKVKCPVCNKEEDKFWIDKYGYCFWCHIKKEKADSLASLKRNTIETGESSCEDYIICPYCGGENSTDDRHESTDINCDECGKEFHVEINCNISYSTSKKEEVEKDE